MDFGAVICKPLPECARCLFNETCKASLQNKQAQLPVKEKKVAVRNRWFHYFLLDYQNSFALQQRRGNDIWKGLFEPPLWEEEKKMEKKALLQFLDTAYGLSPRMYEVVSTAATARQKLTHQLIHFSFVHLQLNQPLLPPGCQWVPAENLHLFPFPRTLQEYLSKNAASLTL